MRSFKDRRHRAVEEGEAVRIENGLLECPPSSLVDVENLVERDPSDFQMLHAQQNSATTFGDDRLPTQDLVATRLAHVLAEDRELQRIFGQMQI